MLEFVFHISSITGIYKSMLLNTTLTSFLFYSKIKNPFFIFNLFMISSNGLQKKRMFYIIKKNKSSYWRVFMNYKLLYTSWYGGQRKVVIFDFKRGMMIEFTIDELKNEDLDFNLKEYIIKMKDQIDTGYWDYPASS